MHIPAWFPGAAWKRLGLELRERFIAMGEEPYEYVKSAMVSQKTMHHQYPFSFPLYLP